MRLRATESQAGLTFRQRRLNVRAAFSVSDPAAVTGKHVLVIDDIFTTGATARAAAQALARAGAASVWVATLARARSSSPFRFAGFDEGAEENLSEPGNTPATNFIPASSYSSHGQPSF
jgi:hypoxanthine phosphoribosyltransferase